MASPGDQHLTKAVWRKKKRNVAVDLIDQENMAPRSPSRTPLQLISPEGRLSSIQMEVAQQNEKIKALQAENLNLKKLLKQESPSALAMLSIDNVGLSEDSELQRPPGYEYPKAVVIPMDRIEDDDNDATTDNRRLVDSMVFRLVVFLSVGVDIVFVSVFECALEDSSRKEQRVWLAVVSNVLLGVFIVDLLFRLHAERLQILKSASGFLLWNMLDIVVIFLAFIAAFLDPFEPPGGLYVSVSNMLRLLSRSSLVMDRWTRLKLAFQANARLMVTQNKRRYQQDGYDLDLTYVTDRIIAMSLPSVGTEGLYRNPIHVVAQFLGSRHYGHFKVFNLCSERTYDKSLMYNQVENVRINDHCPPTIKVLMETLTKFKTFCLQNPKNTVAVHCKGGKGRTGTVCASMLLFSGFCTTAAEALYVFAQRRTVDMTQSSQGVTAPSQIRYVHYLEQILRCNFDFYTKHNLYLDKIRINTVPRTHKAGCCLNFMIYCNDELQYQYSKGNEPLSVPLSQGYVEFVLDGVKLSSDVKVEFFSVEPRAAQGGREKLIFFTCFHTSFLDPKQPFVLQKKDVDKAYRDTSRTFHEYFSLEFHFQDRDPEADQQIGSEDLALQAFRTKGELQKFSYGQAIMQQGQVARSLYIITQGTALVQVDIGGEIKTIKEVGTQETFGEVSFLVGTPATANVVANEMVVEVRVLQAINDGTPYSHIRIPRFDDLELVSLYYMLAANLAQSLATATKKAAAETVYAKAAQQAVDKRTQFIQEFALPLTSIFIHTCACTHRRSKKSEVQGAIVLFEQYLCFQGTFFGVKSSKVVFAVKHMAKVSSERECVISIVVQNITHTFVFKDESDWRIVYDNLQTNWSSLSSSPDLDEVVVEGLSSVTSPMASPGGVQGSELEWLMQDTEGRVYKENEEILKEGSTTKNLYHVTKGSVRVENKDRQVLAKLFEGDIFGEISFLESGNAGAKATVVADEETEVAILSHENVLYHCDENPILGAVLYHFLACVIVNKRARVLAMQK